MVTKYTLKNYNKDRDVKAGESSSKDSSKDNSKVFVSI